MALEVERKYLDVDFAALVHALHAANAHDEGAHFESNVLFDSPDGCLRAAGRLLRLRTREWPAGPQKAARCDALLTLKLPLTWQTPPDSAVSSTGDAIAKGAFKMREEREILVSDASAMRGILEGLGYAEAAHYEKIRHEFYCDTVMVQLDALPFINVVELEGAPEAIFRVEQQLGLDNAVISTKNYHELHQEFRCEHDLPFELSFVFDAATRRQRRRLLGLDS